MTVLLTFLAFVGFGVCWAAMLFVVLLAFRYVRQYFRRGRHTVTPERIPLLVLQWRHERPMALGDLVSVDTEGWFLLGYMDEEGIRHSSDA